MEHLLQYTWKHRLFPLKGLETTEGKPIEVIDPGRHNRHDGPDFFNAKLKIDGTLWVGDVEVHLRSSDWYRHGHQRNKAYNSVILHVVGEADRPVCRPSGGELPQLVLSCPPQVATHYQELKEATAYPCCTEVVASLPRLVRHSWFTALQAERLQQKAVRVQERLALCDQRWDDAFWVTLARSLGFGSNGDALERWAASLPLRAMEKHRDALFQIEAFCMGQAGWLDETETPAADDYHATLIREYTYLKKKFDCRPRLSLSDWKWMGVRPSSSPALRLAQLAMLYHRSDHLFAELLATPTLAGVRQLLEVEASDYWQNHHRPGKEIKRRSTRIGASSIDLMIINAVVPFLYAYGLHKADDRLCQRALALLDGLKPEDNHVVRSWQTAGIRAESAADSQALIQLRTAYCEARKCLFCRFGYEYIRRSDKQGQENPSQTP